MTSAIARLRRRVNRRFYRLLYRTYRLLLPTDVGRGPVDPRGLRRVLVMPNYKVGDLVVALPAIEYLRSVASNARIDLLLSPRNASLVDGDARVDRVLLHDPRAGRWPAARWAPLARRLRRERYDLVVDFVLPHHVREGLLTALVAGRHGARVAPWRPAPAWGLFTHRARVPGFERRYMSDRLLYAAAAAVRTVRGSVDIDALRSTHAMRLAIDPTADARAATWLADSLGGEGGSRHFVAVNAWASDPVRTLDVVQTRAVLTALAARYPTLAFVLTPPPGALDDATAMAQGTGALVFPPAPSLADLVALLARSALVLTPDTANIHLAAAVGRPVLALFATVATENLAHWIPSGVPYRVARIGGQRALREMPPAQIVEAFDALWADLRAPDPPRDPRLTK